MVNAPKQDRSRQTHRKLIECTIRILASKGLQATTVSLVAEEAGVSRGAAQHHFPTREALIKEAIEQISAERTAVLREAMASLDSEGAGAPAEDVARLVFEVFSGDLFHAAVHVWAAAASDQKLKEIIMPAEARYNREVYELTARALHADLTDRHTRRLLTVLLDLGHGLGLSSMLIDPGDRIQRHVEACGAVLQGIKRLA
ncbi:TetR/AcrR family transcriptional regulator [Gephyromycinifex aptenodytis]|uniref:TetR/AcrR family transcriptional regulator n=1 Tax=Gephyromycinifex aptenodytis TaxID=2716227 RepID=UPI001445AE6D|nr:TetR/AcrR family transcriptional regulator [Gephyromycinifex aptenodytis]